MVEGKLHAKRFHERSNSETEQREYKLYYGWLIYINLSVTLAMQSVDPCGSKGQCVSMQYA